MAVCGPFLAGFCASCQGRGAGPGRSRRNGARLLSACMIPADDLGGRWPMVCGAGQVSRRQDDGGHDPRQDDDGGRLDDPGRRADDPHGLDDPGGCCSWRRGSRRHGGHGRRGRSRHATPREHAPPGCKALWLCDSRRQAGAPGFLYPRARRYCRRVTRAVRAL